MGDLRTRRAPEAATGREAAASGIFARTELRASGFRPGAQ
jgi:hypothetical protein